MPGRRGRNSLSRSRRGDDGAIRERSRISGSEPAQGTAHRRRMGRRAEARFAQRGVQGLCPRIVRVLPCRIGSGSSCRHRPDTGYRTPEIPYSFPEARPVLSYTPQACLPNASEALPFPTRRRRALASVSPSRSLRRAAAPCDPTRRSRASPRYTAVFAPELPHAHHTRHGRGTDAASARSPLGRDRLPLRSHQPRSGRAAVRRGPHPRRAVRAPRPRSVGREDRIERPSSAADPRTDDANDLARSASAPARRWWPTTPTPACTRLVCGGCCASWATTRWPCSTAASRSGWRRAATSSRAA